MRRLLPSHNFELYGGISTNLRPDELGLSNALVAQNVDSYERFRCVGKVPGSTRVSASHGAVIRSLHYFEFLDLAGTETRQHLSFAQDGVLRLIDSSTGALTTLQSGLTADDLRSVESKNRLHLTSPLQFGLATGGIKYDGTRTTNWGVLAPGQAETVHQALNSSSDWTASTDAALANNTASQDGSGSVQINKTGTSSTEAYLQRTGQSHNFSALGQDTLFVYLYLPYGVLQKLATSGTAVQVILGTSGFTNVNNYNFSVGELVPGWNLLSMLVNSPDSTGGSGATESNITNLRLRLVVSSSSQTFTGVLWDKMFSQAAGAPTAAAGAAGSITGTRSYRVAFLTEYGLLSNGGPVSNSVTVSAKQIGLTAIPVSSDTQVIARYIYCDISGDGLWRFVGQLDDNVTTTFTDTIPDASLGASDLPLAGDQVLDNTPPGRLHACVVWQNRIIGIDADDRFRLIVGEIDTPEAARLVDQLVLEETLVALEVHAYGLLIYSTDSLYLMTGDGLLSPFFIERVSPQVGANSHRGVATIKNIHMVQHEHEVYLVVAPVDPWLINKHRLDHFRDDIPASTRGDGFAIHDRSRFRVIFFNKGSSADYDQIDLWQYGVSGVEQVSGEGAGVDPQDTRLGGWYTLSLPATVNPQCAVMVERTADLPELWVGGEDGYVYWLGSTAATWAENTGTAAINAQYETHAVPLGVRPGGRGIPRFLRINGDADAESVWTVTVTLLSDSDGATIDSTSFTVTLGAGKTSVVASIPAMGSRGEWCRVKIANATSTGVGVIRGLELFYIPRPVDFRGKRAA